MPTKYQRTSLRATFYTEEALKEAVERIRNKELTNYAASKMYGIPTSTLNDRVLSKSGLKSKTLGRSQAIPPEMEARLAVGLRTMEKWGWGLSKEEVLDTVAAFVKVNKLQTPFRDSRPGIKWFISFRERHKLSVKKPQAVEILRKRMTDPFVVDEYFTLLKEVLTELNIDDPRRIWNLDETSVALDPSKTKVVGAVGHPSTRTTAGSGKENITVLATVNAAGEKLNPLIVFKGKNVYEEWMLKEKTNFDFEIAYAASKRGWMEAEFFLNYMANQVLPGIGTERPQLMVYDGHVTHIDERVIALAAENGLTILKLPAHTSHLLQPLDLAVFKSFKSIWDRKLVLWQRENIGMKVRKQAFAQLFAEAWQQTSPEVIRNGFKKGGIYPYNPNVVPIDKFDQAAYKRWQKHVGGNPQNSASKEICLKSLVQSCLDVINKASNRSSSSYDTVNERLSITELTEPNKAMSFEDLLLQKIKQQTNGKTANKLTRVAKGSEVITWTYLEKQKQANEEILRSSQSAADNEKPGSSGIQNITKNTKTKNSTSTKGKGVGKKTKTVKLTSNSKTEKDLDDIEQNKLIKTSKIKKETKESKRITKANPSKKMKRSPSIVSTFVDSDEISLRSDSDLEDLPSYFFTHLEKQKEADEEILHTSQSAADNEKPGSSGIQNITKNTKTKNSTSTKGKGVGKKTKTTKLTSNSKTEKDLDDIEQNKLIKTSKIKKETKESKRITKANPLKKMKRSPSIASTFVDSDEISLRSDSDLEDLPSYFFTHLEKQKEANEEILHTSQSAADNEKPGSSGIQNITKNTKTKNSTSTKGKDIGKKTKTTKLTSNSNAEKDLDDIKQNKLIKTTILMDTEELLLREKEIERIIKEIRADEKEIENTKNYTVMENETSKMKENEGKENKLIQTNIITQEKTQVRDDTKYQNKKDSHQSKKKVSIISSVLVTPNESAFAKYSIRNLKMIDPKSDLCNPNPNKSLAGIQMKGDEQEHTTEHPIQPTLYDVGDTVLTRYFKKTWIYYVGTVKSVDTKERKYTISFCRTVGKNENVMFVIPKRIDEDYVPEENIVKTIELLQINENPLQYALLNDEDSVYF